MSGFTIGAKGRNVQESEVQDATTQILLEEVIDQLRLANLYLSRLAGEELTLQDVGED